MGIADFLKQYHSVAVDTNVFIAVFAQEPLGKNVLPLIDATANQGTHSMITSVLVFSECAVGPYKEGNWPMLDQVKLMFQMPGLTVCPLDETIAEEAARLRAVYNLKMPDAIVAATAIVREAEVLLTNDRRFQVMKEIPVVLLDEL